MEDTAEKYKPIIDEFKFNKVVKERLSNLGSQVEQANSPNDIIHLLTNGSESGHIVYKNAIGYLLIAFAIISFAAPLYFKANGASDTLIYTLLAIGAALVVSYFVYTWKERTRKKQIERFFSRYEEVKYGFTYGANQSNIDFSENVKLFNTAFSRGNYDDTMVRHASGKLTYDEKDVEYTLLHYRFTHRHVEMKKRIGKKNKKYITDYIHNIHGVMISDIKFPAFFLSTSRDSTYYDVPWTTSNGDFNDKFVISAKNEIEIAKLLQPRNILWFEKVFENMPYEPQKVTKTGNKEHTKIEYSVLDHTEMITSDSYPSLYWNLNINFFNRTSDNQQKFKTTAELANSLKTVELKGFEKFKQHINLLLERAV